MGIKKRLMVIAIILGTIFVVLLIGELILAFTGASVKLPVLDIILIFAVPLFAIGSIALFVRYYVLYSASKQLITENLYNFGEAIELYDLHAFEERVNFLSKTRKAKKSKGQFIISFTASTLISVQNLDRDEKYSQFHAKTAKLLDALLVPSKKGKRRETAYCFNHGTFVVYLFINDESQIRDLINNIKDGLYAIEQPGITAVSVTPFFGIAELTKEASIVEVVENAGIARNVGERHFETITFYSDKFRKSYSYGMVEEITRALANNEFVVHYQPKFNLNTRRFVSAEALVRWDSKTHGLISPAKFIPAAEAAGLIHEIDTFVFRRVCEDLNEAKRRGRRIVPISVNFSLYEFFSSEFLSSILKILDDYKINPSYVEIEITEATSQANTFMSVNIIKKLREAGIRVLMDDFGVGFSNIGNLRKIPFDAVKIDKSFIDDIVSDTKSRAIVKFLIELCQANDMEVIAEGVDNKEQCEILRKLRCNTIQGFYYSKALPVKEYERFLLSNPFEKKEG